MKISYIAIIIVFITSIYLLFQSGELSFKKTINPSNQEIETINSQKRIKALRKWTQDVAVPIVRKRQMEEIIRQQLIHKKELK